jgi:hypothetical protein
MTPLTLKRFRELTSHLPEDSLIMYHSYDKGCSLSPYSEEELWVFEGRIAVINPGERYDGRKPKK